MQISQYLKRPSSLRTLFAGIAVLSFITPVILEASSSPEQKTGTVTCLPEYSYEPADSAYLFRGKLVDKGDTSAAIADVSVYISNTDVELLSNTEGRFEFVVPKELRTKRFTLTISAMGYESVNIIVDPTKTDYTVEHLYLLKESESEYMMGDTIMIIQEVK